jgi:hypothetical protein
MTLYLLKVHQQTFLSIPITQKYQILSCDTLVANERYVILYKYFALPSYQRFVYKTVLHFETSKNY